MAGINLVLGWSWTIAILSVGVQVLLPSHHAHHLCMVRKLNRCDYRLMGETTLWGEEGS